MIERVLVRTRTGLLDLSFFFLTRFQVIVERVVPSYSNTEIKIMEL